MFAAAHFGWQLLMFEPLTPLQSSCGPQSVCSLQMARQLLLSPDSLVQTAPSTQSSKLPDVIQASPISASPWQATKSKAKIQACCFMVVRLAQLRRLCSRRLASSTTKQRKSGSGVNEAAGCASGCQAPLDQDGAQAVEASRSIFDVGIVQLLEQTFAVAAAIELFDEHAVDRIDR